jgi:archaetidylinositol phosphate synthase
MIRNGVVTDKPAFLEATRAQVGLLAPVEKKCLICLAHHTPEWIDSDRLTILDLAALLGAGLSYWWASVNSAGLLLAVVCLALSGYMSPVTAIGLLIVYFMLSIEVYLATYTIGTFHLSFWNFSPTELRIMLIAGNLVLLWRPVGRLFGYSWRLFDVGGAVGICGMALMLVNSKEGLTSAKRDHAVRRRIVYGRQILPRNGDIRGALGPRRRPT